MGWIGSNETPFAELGMTQDKLTLLQELAEDSPYWTRAHRFVNAVRNRRLSSLSDYQRRWLTTIIMDLDNELYKKSWRY